jgi:hypothetical protein
LWLEKIESRKSGIVQIENRMNDGQFRAAEATAICTGPGLSRLLLGWLPLEKYVQINAGQL